MDFTMIERLDEALGSDNRSFALSTILESQIILIFSITCALVIKCFKNCTS